MTAILKTGGKGLLAGGRLLMLSGGGSSGGGSGGGGGSSGLSNIALFQHGQSNSNFFTFWDGAALLQAQCVSAWLGGTGTPAITGQQVSCVAGTGVYLGISGYGTFLTYTADTVAAAEAATYSGTGTGMIAAINALSSAQKSATLGMLVDWGEADSLFAGTGYAGIGGLGYGDKPVYKAALKNDFAQIRAAFGKTAAQLPILIFGVTYGSAQGYAMVREAWAELAADPANNLVWGVQQTGDDITRGDNWDPTTGVVTTGSPISGHVDSTTNLIFAGRSSLAFARIIAASQGLPAGVIPPVFGAGLGPQITAAHLSGATVTCTVQHDAGNDLVVPLLASQGVGFTVMDGGSVGSPGNTISATACARVDATHFAITLASAPSNAASACRLFYPGMGPYSAAQPLQPIGRGCAVTDNFSTVLAAQGMTLPSVAGAAWNGNYPLRSPMTVTGSGSGAAAAYGLALS